MKTYQKIETLYKFNTTINKFVENDFTNPIVKYLYDCKWIGSEKIDGTNIRVLWDGFSFSIAGRTEKSDVPKEVKLLFDTIFNKDAEIIIEQIFGVKEVIFCMEAYGGKIQNGTYKISERLIGFDIMVNENYIQRESARDIFEKINIPFVPLYIFKNLKEAIDFVKTNPVSQVDNTAYIEGLVCLPYERIYDNQGNRIAVKIKVRDFNKTINIDE